MRKYKKADKFSVGTTGNKPKKFVEAAKNTNLYFAVFEKQKNDKTTVRCYATIPLNIVIDCQKKYKSKWKEEATNILKQRGDIDKEAQLLFIISPNDLVYLPTQEELISKHYSFDKERIYKFVSSTGNQCFFIKAIVAKSIVEKVEFSPLNKMEKAITGEMIKEICIPIKVDRLGNIIGEY